MFSTLKTCVRTESLIGKVRWAAAIWCLLFGVASIVSGNTAIGRLATYPVVLALLAKVITWSWRYTFLPFTGDSPVLRRLAMGLMVCFWSGWFVLATIDQALTGSRSPTGLSEPGVFTQFRYNWMGSLVIMIGLLWVVAAGEWIVRRVMPRLLAGPSRWCDCKPVHRSPHSGVLNGKCTTQSKPDPARVVAAVLWALYVLLTATSIHAGHATPRVVHVTLPMAGLPQCLSGYKVAMLSDVHGGPLVGLTDVGKYVEQLNALKADAQVLVGDMVDGPPSDRGDVLAPVGRLNAPDGSYYVTGNHEYSHGSTGNDWLHWMETQGLTVLNNTGLALPRPVNASSGEPVKTSRFTKCTDSDTFDLLGVVDKAACQNDPALCERGRIDTAVAAAKAKLRPTQAAQVGTPARASLLLAHQPLDADKAAEAGLTAQIAGHTHGGQIWPIHWSTYLVNKGRIAGGYEISRGKIPCDDADEEEQAEVFRSDRWMQLYVNEGAVGWGPRLRFWAQTEITLLTLVPPDELGGRTTAFMSTDNSHPARLGGFVASVLLIVSVVVLCISKLLDGFASWAKASTAQKTAKPEAILVLGVPTTDPKASVSDPSHKQMLKTQVDVGVL